MSLESLEDALDSESEDFADDDGSGISSFAESESDTDVSDADMEIEEEDGVQPKPKRDLKSYAFDSKNAPNCSDPPGKSRRTASRASAGSNRRSSGISAVKGVAAGGAKTTTGTTGTTAKVPGESGVKPATARASSGTAPMSNAKNASKAATATPSGVSAKSNSRPSSALGSSPKVVGLSKEDEERRQANIAAMLAGDLTTSRNSLMPSLLTVDKDTTTLKKPFKSPFPNASGVSDGLMRALLARKQFVPFGNKGGTNFKMPEVRVCEAMMKPTAPYVEPELPPGVEELVLWKSSDDSAQVRVDNMLTKFLRPHQREGVQFLFECVNGLREHDGQGAILADDMGLGKTLQGVALLWTLLNNGHPELGQEEGGKIAKRIVICCPTSLVSNWDSECTKWLQGRVTTMPIVDASRDEVIDSLSRFCSRANPAQVLIISYETFRIHAERFEKPDTCDLLLCDEAHRLKNDQTLTNKALGAMHCKRRVLLSGTPLQNQLQEFFSMVDFCNPGILGTPSEFRKKYERPILNGREPMATEKEREKSMERSADLSAFVNGFILRRTNDLLSKHLPPKVIELVCCKMTPIQYQLYEQYVQSRAVTNLLLDGKKKGGQTALSAITTIRKLMNHPRLIYDMAKSNKTGKTGFESCGDILSPENFEAPRGVRGIGGGPPGGPPGWAEMSGKFGLVSRMLELLRNNTKDRVVLVSNFTQTLDLFTTLCRERRWPCVRLDGSISLSKREKMVQAFNDPKADQFVFLLSSKAGGCGLNLIGGNRLILFDMSWNPADDKQAAARVWRDGQQKRVYVYKMMTTGTIEEKIFQRQINKEGLQSVVDGEAGGDSAQAEENLMSRDQLKDLFTYDASTLSTTFEHMVLDKIPDDVDKGLSRSGPVLQEQTGQPKEDDLGNWGLHSSAETVPDEAMRICGTQDVSFVFSCKVSGKEIPPDKPILGDRGDVGAEDDDACASKVLQVRDINVPTSRAPAKKESLHLEAIAGKKRIGKRSADRKAEEMLVVDESGDSDDDDDVSESEEDEDEEDESESESDACDSDVSDE